MESIFNRKWASSSLLRYARRTAIVKVTPPLLCMNTLRKEDFFAKELTSTSCRAGKCILHPEGALKLSWDAVAMLLIFYQVLAIPYLLAFDVDDITVWNGVDLGITVFFTADIAVNFNTAYYKGGSFVGSRNKVAKHYLKGWFWLDLLTTAPYGLLVNGVHLEERDLSNAAQLFRLLKFYKTLRLLRLLKLKKIMIALEDYLANYFVSTFLVFMRLVVLAFIVAHWIACIWYYIGLLGLETEPETWLTVAYIENYELSEIYITALYWAFTTMTTVGYGDIYPVTATETIFTILAMIVACVTFAYIIGSIEGLIVKHKCEENAHRTQIFSIKSYMKKKKMPTELRFRVQRYLDYIWEYHKKWVLEETELLELLSEPLKEEIFVETRGQTINNCHIFFNFSKRFLLSITKLLQVKTYAPDDVVFSEGEMSSMMFFIQEGAVKLYHQSTETIYQRIGPGGYFGEIAFFTALPRSCSVQCLEFVEAQGLSRPMIAEILQEMPEALRLLEYYRVECSQYDLTTLDIQCFFCNEVGHTASYCPFSVISINNDKMKTDWLNHRKKERKEGSVRINPHDERSPEPEKRGRKRKRQFNRAFNIIGVPRAPGELYNHDLELVQKVGEFDEEMDVSLLNHTRLSSKLDSFIEEQSDNEELAQGTTHSNL